jgi:hypothetical protein
MVASRETGVVDLPRAGVPADHGLASLGLVMQLAGRTSAALAALVASLIVLDASLDEVGWLFFAIGLGIARSSAHRVAGRDVLYGRRTLDGITDPLEATRTYIAFGLLHAVVIGLISTLALGATAATGAGLAAALALWPIVLAVVLRMRRFRRFEAGIPLGEDRGLESASILMTILGACGVLSTGAIVALLGGLTSRHLEHGWGTMIMVVFALLLVRSCLHMRVGIAGLRDTSFDRPGELASRYINFGMISAICVGCVLALLAMSSRTPLAAVAAAVAMSSWLLAGWPMTLKRYVAHRQFAELLAGDRVLHRRAPDAGLTGLGWLLAGHATAAASVIILELTVEPRGAGHMLDGALHLIGAARAPADLAVAAIVVGLEALTAIALIRMTDHRRIVATIYALVAGAVAVTAAWPVARNLGQHSLDLRAVMQWIPAAIQIVIPAATLVLVRRVVVPTARARYGIGPRTAQSDRPDGTRSRPTM